MSDVVLLAATLRHIRDDGGGAAKRQAVGAGFAWDAGRMPLNGQTVSDLIGKGWLKVDGDQAVIDAGPASPTRTAGDRSRQPRAQPNTMTRLARVFAHQEHTRWPTTSRSSPASST